MKAVILAAGRGSRMGSLTVDRPKCLLPVRGRPLIEWQIEALSASGISEICIVTGYKRESLEGFGSVQIYNERWAETNMVTSLLSASDWLGKDPFIISYSDIFYSETAIDALTVSQGDIVITYDTKWLELWKKRFGDPLLDAETFKLNSDGSLKEIGNKPRDLKEIEGQFMGLLRFTKQGFEKVCQILDGLEPMESEKIDVTKLLQRVISEGKIKVFGIPYSQEWGEVDSEKDLRSYNLQS